MDIKEKIEKTQTFKSLNSVQKKLTLQRTNVQHITHGVEVSRNIGYKEWERICQFTERNKNIVSEILDNELVEASA